MLADEQQQLYIKNIEKISQLLDENENLLREAGYKPPSNNYAVEKNKRIKFPTGYIRTSGEFWNTYHLAEIVNFRDVRNNISYALQLSDYYNFLVNRFNIWGSIEIMLYKQAFVNLISIIEALILECANRINAHCQLCDQIGQCSNNINKTDRYNMKNAVNKLTEIGILNLSEVQKDRLIELYEMRNKIHIRLNEQNEFLDNKFNRDLYNETIGMLQYVDTQIYENAVRYYHSCMGYVEKYK